MLKGVWCDCNWKWEPSESDKDHIQSLLNNPEFKSYLVIHVFFCLHDQRRMGHPVSNEDEDIDKLIVPDFMSPLRTVIIDLTDSRDHLTPDAEIIVSCKGLQKVPDSLPQWEVEVSKPDFIIAMANDKPLKIVALQTVLSDLDGYWKKEWALSKL